MNDFYKNQKSFLLGKACFMKKNQKLQRGVLGKTLREGSEYNKMNEEFLEFLEIISRIAFNIKQLGWFPLRFGAC